MARESIPKSLYGSILSMISTQALKPSASPTILVPGPVASTDAELDNFLRELMRLLAGTGASGALASGQGHLGLYVLLSDTSKRR